MTNNTNRAAEAAQPASTDSEELIDSYLEAQGIRFHAATSGDAPADGWPSEIYLNAGDDPLGHFDEYADVSWCDHPQGENDVRYVRAELARIERAAALAPSELLSLPKRVEELIWTAITHLNQDDPLEDEKEAGVKCLQELEEILAASDVFGAASPEPAAELDDSDFYPPKALLKREDWDPVTRKPKSSPATASGDERADFEAWMKTRPGYPFAGAFANLMWDAWQARAAVSAATKPTADLSDLPTYDPDGDGFMERRKWNDGDYYKVSDVQSLLATKPAAAPADRILASVTKEMRAAGLAEANRRDCDADSSDVEMIFNAMLGAAPAASTIGAAQTADQVRDHALEEAARICWELQARPEFQPELQDRMLKVAEDRIRALKRPTPTHSSEAGDA